jgi:hypothetical protein
MFPEGNRLFHSFINGKLNVGKTFGKSIQCVNRNQHGSSRLNAGSDVRYDWMAYDVFIANMNYSDARNFTDFVNNVHHGDPTHEVTLFWIACDDHF